MARTTKLIEKKLGRARADGLHYVGSDTVHIDPRIATPTPDRPERGERHYLTILVSLIVAQ